MTRSSYRKLLIGLTVVAAMGLAVAIWGCGPKADNGGGGTDAATPQADQWGIIESEEWADLYPNQYNTFVSNTEENPWVINNEETNKNALYPEMCTLGKGYGYGNYFTEPGSHTWSLYTIQNNGRVSAEKTKAQCLACKTPIIHKVVEQEGNAAWTEMMFDVVGDYTEGISCVNCHVNDNPGEMQILRADWVRAMGPDLNDQTVVGGVCGQCHCDYSMDAETGEPTSPYDGSGIANMTPENALNWYDEHGYVDYTYESTGAKMLAVRHSEYEYNYGGTGNTMTKLGYDCVDCHMPVETAEDGSTYHSHLWQSPLDNETILEGCNTGTGCHTDLTAEVAAWQDEVWTRCHELGQRTACFVQNFEKALADGSLTDEADIARLQEIQRGAAFYWNSVFAENSRGAHNHTLAMSVLDNCEQLLDEGDSILGVESTVEGFVSEYDPNNPKDDANYAYPPFEGLYVYYTK